MRSVLLPLAIAFLLGCATPSAAAPGPPIAVAPPIATATSISEARAELLRYVGDVTRSTGYRYDAHDDRGHSMDGAKIIQVTETGELAAVYHWFSGVPDRFNVSLATSTNLLDWTWRRDLTEGASQPTIRAASDGGYVVTWDSDADLEVTLHYFSSWDNLLEGMRQGLRREAATARLRGRDAESLRGEQHIGRLRHALLHALRIGPPGARNHRLGDVARGAATAP